MTKPLIIPAFESRPFRHRSTEEVRWNRPLQYCSLVAEDTARRVAASREMFPWKFFRGDCHSHTQHSDGIGTVAETAAMVRHAQLDFQFVTDHWGVTQAPECLEHGLWFGQEPVTQHHHIGILGLDYAFEPKLDFLADFAEAKALGATVFLPHPTGWWPNHVYNEEQRRIVEDLPSPFLMEICNGANNIVSAFDYTDDEAIALWDRLLNMGRTVHAMGNTDAHAPHGIGMVWNGVFAAECRQELILQQLSLGHSFVSDAPLIHIVLGEARMGDRATAADRESAMGVTVVDSRGLSTLRVVADGETAREYRLDGLISWNEAVPVVARRYVRVEVRSADGRRAYSNPIYLGE